MVSPLLLLTFLGCEKKLKTPEAEAAFQKCVSKKLDKPANYESDVMLIRLTPLIEFSA